MNHVVARTLVKRYGKGTDSDATDTMVASTLNAQRGNGGGGISHEETLVAETVRSHPRPGSNSNGNIVAAPLTKGSATGDGVNQPGRRQEDDVNIAAFSENQRAEVLETPIARQLTGGGGKPGQGYPAVREGMGVRRLTPTECERLQGLPDGWTQLGGTPDSRRYSGLGDAVTSPVGYWIGCRLAVVA